MKNIILFSLEAIISAAFGVAITYLAMGWVGKDIVLWGCVVLIFFGIVIGIGHTVIEGIVVAAIFGAFGYFFVNKMPAFLLYIPGAFAGFSTFMIVTGLIAESKEAPQREAQERAWKEQHEQEEAKWKAEQEALEAWWQPKAPASLALIKSSLGKTQKYLNCNSRIDGTKGFYQYANRIAHLYYLRCLNNVEAYLVFVYFLNDWKHIPTQKSEWDGAIQLQKQLMGLSKHKLQKNVIDVFIDVQKIK